MITHGNLVSNEASIKAAFEFDRDDTVVSWLPLFHDMGLVGGLLQPLFSGASVVLLSPQQFLERPIRWLEAISRFGGTISGGPDFAFRLCTERVSDTSLQGLDLSSWTLAFCGSEPIRASTFHAFTDRFSAVGFDGRAAYACYGLAEATLIVTGAGRGEGLQASPFAQGDVVCCGRVQTGHDIRIIGAQGDDNIGEIWFSGPSVSPGYWNNTEATAATFPEVDGARFLRTGDLGFMHEGHLYVTGRQKDLIIVRGQNIYPQDVEELIETEVEAVRRGRVAAFPIVSDGQEAIGVAAEISRAMQRIISPDALADTISETIANVYQEPAKLVLLLQPGALPKTSSGKLQRGRCYELWQSGELGLFASRGPEALTENKGPAPQSDGDGAPGLDEVIEIWKSVLQTDMVGRGDNFFLIGGNSITGVQVIARLRERLGIALELHHLFEAPTPVGLAGKLQQSLAQRPAPAPAIPARAGLAEARASHAQERLWFLWQLEPSSPAYNISGAVRLLGPLNDKTLEGAITRIVQRHETLRTSFSGGPDGTLQRVHQSYAPAIARDDLSALDEEARETQVERLLDEEAATPFDLKSGPPLRIRLVRCAAQDHRLIVTVHHIACDAWSMQLLIDEFVALYDSFVGGFASALFDLPIQYIDFAEWQRNWLRGGETERQLAYWRQKLGSDHPALELPADRPHRPDRSHRGDTHRLVISPGLTTQLRSLSQTGQATMFMVLLASFKTLLYRYTGQQEIRVGVPTANRTQTALEGLIGVFVNTQVLSTVVAGHLRFDEVLARVKTTVLEAQTHQELPFDQLVDALRPERRLTHNPLFEVMVNHLETGRSRRIRHAGGLDIEILRTRNRDTQFDLSLDIEERADEVELIFTYAVDLFEAETIARLGRHLEGLLKAIAGNPGVRLADIPLLDSDEGLLVLDRWGRGESRPAPGCLHEIIAARANECQDAVAVVCADATLTYSELNARAARLAGYLREQGVGPDVLVGIAVERSIEMIVGLLGILKAGGAYVPLDPSYPADRLAFMIADSRVSLVLTQERLLDTLPPLGRTPMKDIAPGSKDTGFEPASGRYFCLDRDWPAIEAYGNADIEVDVIPLNLAYCIYTSGSTGRPKAAANTHQAIVNRLDWMQNAYKVDSADRVLHKTPFSFDVSVWELFLPLMFGAQLIVAPPDVHRYPRRISALIDAHQITILHFVPSMVGAFIEADSVTSHDSLRRVICSGEALRPDLQNAFLARYGVHLDNLYGPTEAAIDVSFWRCRQEQGAYSIPIGCPIWNTQLCILDADLNAVPQGATGELYIGGVGLARGYQNRPALTAERFIPNPFPQRAGERLYRTGDLARWRPDGVIEYVGRIDHQVKIRGFRIELGEIEAQLLAHAEVHEAVVVARDGGSGKQLVGYVVARGEPADGLCDRLREHLGSVLPDYMVPAHVLVLEALPLMPNGKLDRKTLPEPDVVTAEYMAPRNAVEEKLVAIWREVLGLDRVGVTDNFFGLGGDSILSLQVIARARRAGLKITPRQLFERQTIEQLGVMAQIIESVVESAVVEVDVSARTKLVPSDIPLAGLTQARIDGLPVPAREIEDVYPLSPMQQGILFHALHDPSSGHYVNQLSVAVEGLDLERFKAAWASVTARHAVLRTSFVWEGDVPHPLQIVHKSVPPAIEVMDWLDRAVNDEEIAAYAAADRAKGFDLTRAPLQRMTVLRLADGRHQLIWTHHHLLMDGWSTARQIEETFAHYLGEALGPVSGRYRDYIAWLSRQDKAASEAFWKERLLALDEPTSIVDALAGARGRNAGRHATITCRLDAEATARLQRFAQQERVTLNTLVQGAWALLLQRYCGQRTVAFGATVAGRPADLPGAEAMLGLFINTLPVIQGPRPEQHIGDWLRQLQADNVAMREHEQVPLYDIQRWAGQPGQALFDTILVFENYPVDEALRQRAGKVLTFGGMENVETTNYAMTVVVVERADGLAIDVSYMEARLDRAQVEAVVAHLAHLLEGVATDAGALPGDLRLLLPAEHAQVVEQWSRGEARTLDGRCLHELIEVRVREHPDAVAVVYEDTQLTYGELNARANRLARHLQSQGVGPDVLVGLAVERSLEMVVGLLGIIKAGGAYVPLDPSYPAERLAFMIEDARVPLILTQERVLEQLPLRIASHHAGGDATETGSAAAIPTVWCLDRDWHAIEELDAGNLPTITTPQNLAYCIYTSGSTGRPKGTLITHGNVLRLFEVTEEQFGFDSDDVWSLFHSHAFDFSVWELFGALLYGGRLVVVPYYVTRTPELFLGLLQSERVTVLNQTPSAFRSLIQALSSGRASLIRYVVFGGEALDIKALDLWFARFGDQVPQLVNMYGITETTVHVTYRPLSVIDTALVASPVGSAISDLSSFILDRDLDAVPVGIVGELYIGGAGLARGYHGRPGLTAERFVPNHYAQEPGERLYRTGDLARWRPDGTIEYVGRIDHQVKVRGFRIELGEIEAQLLSHGDVREAVVVARDGGSGKQLVGYVVPRGETGFDLIDRLRSHLAAALPDYMMPAHLVMLDVLPLTPNGKLDRKALPEPDVVTADYVAPRNEAEATLAAIWQAVLGVERVGVSDNFFVLGGDSILSLQIIARARRTGLKLTPKQLFERQTVEGLAAVVEVEATTSAVERDAVSGPMPLLPIQQAFFAEAVPHRNHWNQSVLLKVQQRIDAAAMETALRSVVAHHDAFRLRFRRCVEAGGWSAEHVETGAPDDARLLWLHEVSSASDATPLYEEAQRSLSIEHGPLLRALYVRLTDGTGRLLLVVHHLVVDGVSWRVLLDDLQSAYHQLLVGETITLPAKTSSFQAWAERLRSYATSEALAEELPFWCEQLSPIGLSELPRDRAVDGGLMCDAASIEIRLDQPTTAQLLKQAPEAYRTQVNDLLLTALARVLCRWCSSVSVLVALEGHGREDLFGDIDLSHTVGWFTSLFPVRLTIPLELVLDGEAAPSLGTSIKAIKEQLRGVPSRGLGYGILKHLSAATLRSQLDGLAEPRVTFNYLGQFDGSFDDDGAFVPAQESGGHNRDPDAAFGSWLSIDGQVYNGELRLSFAYSRHMYDAATIEGLAQEYQTELEAVIAHCLSEQAQGLTSSDIPLAGLTQARIDGLPVAAREIEDVYPLSPMQQGMLFHALHDPSSGHYVNQLSVAVEGLDLERFEAAWASVTARHAVLRTSFVWEGDVPHPLQIVHKSVPTAIDVIDWRGRAAAEINGFAVTDRARGFDFGVAPLQRVSVLRLGGGRHQLIWTHHHLLMDGWSTARQIEEVFAHYLGEALGPVSGRYRDYIAWLSQQDKAASEAFWKERLVALDEPTLLVDALAGARGRHEGADGHDTITCRLDAAATARLQRFAQQERVTLNTLVQAAWILLLQRYCGQRTVTFGATVAGRPADLPGAEGILGLFINTLPVIQGPGPEQHIGDWLRQLQAENVMLREHEQVPLYDIQRWAGQPGQALFDTILVFENYPVDEALRQRSSAALNISDITINNPNHYALTLNIDVTDDLNCHFAYAHDKLTHTIVRQLASNWCHLLTSLSSLPETPAGTLAEVALLSGDDITRFRNWGHGTRSAIKSNCVHQLIEFQAARYPHNLALVCESSMLTYGEIDQRANKLANHLRELGVGPEVLVGVVAERSNETMIGMLAILKAGGVYVPIDPDAPLDRIRALVADNEINVLIVPSDPDYYQSLITTVIRPDDYVDTDISAPRNVNCTSDNIAYVIFTSGSTGLPKGVAVTHRSLVNYISTMMQTLSAGPSTNMAMISTLAADLGHTILFGALCSGATLHLLSSEYALDGRRFASYTQRYAIDVLKLTPTHLRGLGVGVPLNEILPAQSLILGGESLAPSLISDISEADGTCRVINHYGPTETTVGVLTFEIAKRHLNDRVPLGSPLSNVNAYILSQDLEMVPCGIVGELFIGGASLARGYHRRPHLTAERFVPNPFASVGGERMYRTGDLARWQEDGQIEYVGRLDQQVKVRGFRVEIGEIEAHLRTFKGILDGAVTLRDADAGQMLWAYVVPNHPEHAVEIEDDIKRYLRTLLPEYMVPTRVIVLPILPMTSNGKTDRRALSELNISAVSYVSPQTDTERTLVAIWQDVLGVERVGVTDNFFDLGGDSIRGLLVISRACREGIGLTPKLLFTTPTIAEIAKNHTARSDVSLEEMASTASVILADLSPDD
ncbi:MAG: non-ribosomal peptide synthetase [Nitrobacter sp.]